MGPYYQFELSEAEVDLLKSAILTREHDRRGWIRDLSPIVINGERVTDGAPDRVATLEAEVAALDSLYDRLQRASFDARAARRASSPDKAGQEPSM